MKRIFVLTGLVAGLGLLAACGKKEGVTKAADASTPPATPAAVAPTNTATPAVPPAAVPAAARVIEITCNDAMKFSVTRIEAKPGEELKIVLINQGTAPKEAMGHNWVLLAKGANPTAYAAAAVAAKATEYLPPALSSQVLAHTKLLGPRQRDEVTFKAPTEPGEYVYLCSFPAHLQLGMKGVLVVQ